MSIQKIISYTKNPDTSYTKKVVYFPRTTITTYTLYKITSDGKLKQYNEEGSSIQAGVSIKVFLNHNAFIKIRKHIYITSIDKGPTL